MKSLLFTIGLCYTSLFASNDVAYVDLYGEIQVNMIVAEKCLEEVAYTRSLQGEHCSTYYQVINTDVYKSLVQRNFADFNTTDTHWTKEDWVILKNQMKKLIYVTDLIKQFR